jgi:hypothetical protein
MHNSFEHNEARLRPALTRGEELRLQAEICHQLAASALTERNRGCWLRLAKEWLELAERADRSVGQRK